MTRKIKEDDENIVETNDEVVKNEEITSLLSEVIKPRKYANIPHWLIFRK